MSRQMDKWMLYVTMSALLCQWVLPIGQLGNLFNISYFLLFVVSLLALFIREVKRRYLALFFFLYTLVAYGMLYYSEQLASFIWIKAYFAEAFVNGEVMLSGNYGAFTDGFRSLLLFSFFGLVTYLVYYYVYLQRRALIFVGLTVCYIGVLDSFFRYDGATAIVYTMLCSFLLLASQQIAKQPHSLPRRTWWGYAATITAIMVVVSYQLPTIAPQWPDPVPFLQAAWKKGTGEGGEATVGYREQDNQLGGPFKQNDEVVFEVRADDSAYYRIETKNVYTGSGWEANPLGSEPYIISVNNARMSYELRDSITTVAKTAKIVMKQELPVIAYPMELTRLTVKGINNLQIRTATDELRPIRDGKLTAAREYEVDYRVPQYDVEQLRSERANRTSSAFYYASMPEKLPERVRELALTITAKATNRYDKAKAIEQYFRTNGFAYDSQNVPVPKKGQDYVDQFLFDTKRGYCDNFSTAMVVLATEAGIPARWVKGFTGGTFRFDEQNRKWYTVTNNNAHAWVEVYFDGFGWVPFEPTIGYVNQARLIDNRDPASTNPSQPNVPATVKKQEVKPKETTKQNKESSIAIANVWNGSIISVIGSLASVALIVFLYWQRRRLYARYLLIRYRTIATADEQRQAYNQLVRLLAMNGVKRRSEQTLREYATLVDRRYEMSEMTTLTERHERLMYYAPAWQNSDNFSELFKKIINKITS